MPKLYELIAVEPDLKKKALETTRKAMVDLNAKGLFEGESRVYQPQDEFGETFPDEVTRPRMNAWEVLKSFVVDYCAYLAVTLGKEKANGDTSADVVIDGVTILTSMRAPMLLNLEQRLDEIKMVYDALPILDEVETWHTDLASDEYVSEPRITHKTKKVLRNHVRAEATKEHPAQVDTYTEDVRVGTWTKIARSTAFSRREKKELLERVDKLIVAVKEARQRANAQEAEHQTAVVDALFGYINYGFPK